VVFAAGLGQPATDSRVNTTKMAGPMRREFRIADCLQ
jgi:hypothetical protein